MAGEVNLMLKYRIYLNAMTNGFPTDKLIVYEALLDVLRRGRVKKAN